MLPTPSSPWPSRMRWALYAGMALLALLAVLCPPVAQPPGYHAFADQRAWGALPHAMDVLSNLGFVAAALAGACALARCGRGALPPAVRGLSGLFFAGLACAGVASAWYHGAPHDATLAWDRLAMAVAFAGLLGLAVQTRVDDRSAWAVALAVLAAGPWTLYLWAASGNVLPWALLQGGGMLAVLALACVPPRAGALALHLGAVIAFYALAKLLEWGDATVFAATQGGVSGHSLKHLVAACAALPVIAALRAGPPQGTIAASSPRFPREASTIRQGRAR